MVKEPSTPERSFDEPPLSLVDMMVVLLTHWKSMVLVFIVGTVLTFTFAWLMPERYSYTSLYNISEYVDEDGNSRALEAPESLLARVRSVYLEAESQWILDQRNLDSLPFELDSRNPSSSMLLVLRSEANKSHSDLVENLHGRILSRLEEHQKNRVDQRRASLQRQLETISDQLGALRNSEGSNTAVLIAGYQERLANLETLLEQLQEGEVAQVAVQSRKPAGVSRSLIIALGILLSLLLAPLSAAVMHFASLVSAKMRQVR